MFTTYWTDLFSHSTEQSSTKYKCNRMIDCKKWRMMKKEIYWKYKNQPMAKSLGCELKTDTYESILQPWYQMICNTESQIHCLTLLFLFEKNILTA